MSTNSSVSVKIGDKVKTIYGHWDGYPSWVGRILKESYNSQEKAEALVALGDFSSLDHSIEAPEGHSFDKPIDGYTVFYGRDRGEDDVEAKVYNTIDEAIREYSQEFNYFWDGDKWMVQDHYDSDEWVELTDKIVENADG
jgi:hypothetical protein